MQTIQLKNKTIELPNHWDDVNEKQAHFIFDKMSLLFQGKLQPLEFQFLLLQYFTGYKPKQNLKVQNIEKGLHGLVLKLTKGKKKYQQILQTEQQKQENILFNLIQLSEKIDFLFKIENDTKIVPLYNFNRNPFYKTSTVFFTRDITVETNITAKQFVDSIDLLRAIQTTQDDNIKQRCMIKLVALLNGFSEQKVEKLGSSFIFGTVYWFTGVYHFFRTHPIFSVLYSRNENSDDDNQDDSLSLGMTEILLYLEKEGYRDIQQKNIIDFFSAQIKSLKDSLNSAISKGAKLEDIANQTKISIKNIKRLTNG